MQAAAAGRSLPLKKRRTHKPVDGVLPEGGTSDGVAGVESEEDANGGRGEQQGAGGAMMAVLPATQDANLPVGTQIGWLRSDDIEAVTIVPSA